MLVKTLRFLINHPLNHSNKTNALIRFLKWQIGSRLIPGETVFKWINDSKMIVKTGETGMTGNIYCGLHEFQDMAFLLHVLRNDDLFVDIGANVGSYTILACAVIGAKGYCFEPVPATFKRLISNIRINDLEKRVIAENIALGNLKGELHFSSHLDCMNHVLNADEYNENDLIVKVSTLDDVIEGEPFLMKIDVEGYETPAVEGAEKILSNEKLCGVIMELNDSGEKYGYHDDELVRKMLNYGFQPYSYDPFQRHLIHLKGKNLTQGNTIFARDIDTVTNRVKTAPKIEVYGNFI